MNQNTERKMVREIQDWRRRGYIDDKTADDLVRRYETGASFLSAVLYWLSLLGIVTLAGGFLGLVALTSGSVEAVGVLFGFGGMIAIVSGGRLATRVEGDTGYTGSALLTIGNLLVFCALLLWQSVLSFSVHVEGVAFCMLLSGVVAGGVAYLYARRWPLLLGLILLFHGLGAWGAYSGSGTYVMSFQNLNLLAVSGLLSVGVGLFHEFGELTGTVSRWVGFGHHYIVVGFIYLNTALWIQAFPDTGFLFFPAYPDYRDVIWILVFAGGSILQIVLGAMMDDSRFIGFGIVFLAINCYTRYYEFFWDRFSLGTFLFLGGLVLFGLGSYVEHGHRKQTSLRGDSEQ